MGDDSFPSFYQHLGSLRETCKHRGVVLPTEAYASAFELTAALGFSSGNEQGALKLLTAKFGRTNKRGRPEPSVKAQSANKKSRNAANQQDDGAQAAGENESEPIDVDEEAEEGEEDQEGTHGKGEEPLPPHRQVRLATEVREKPAVNAANQKIVDAFTNYGEKQLDRGHTGKGVSHLRAALHIRDYPDVIKSGMDARAVPMVGEKMATQVEQVLEKGELVDDTPWLNVSTSDVSTHTPPDLVVEVQNGRAKCPENQVLVDELAKFGEHELYFGSSGKGTSHLRAARELQLTDVAVTSGSQARELVPLVGDVIADKIDQILKHGRIIQDVASSRGTGDNVAPIVQDLRENPAKKTENQPIVDALVDYGDSHLYSGHRGKGISHLRAAQAIRDSDTVVTSGDQASNTIDMVGERVGAKIDQILEHGHADSEYEEEEGEVEEGDEYGVREREYTLPPLAREVRGKPAQVQKNQPLVDALANRGEEQLAVGHTGRGTAYLRAARQLRDADKEVKSGAEARTISRIGDKVAAYIDTIVG